MSKGPASTRVRMASIQGERERKTTWTEPASEGDVDRYVDSASDEVLACRERGRHLFPAIRQIGMVFTEVDNDGLFVRRLTCVCCRLAIRVEKWDGARHGSRVRFQRVTAHVQYQTGSNGERYLSAAGSGRITPRQVADSVASKVLQGQSLASLRKALPRASST
jgi:hypothetical protein